MFICHNYGSICCFIYRSLFCAEKSRRPTRAETRSQACLTSAWSTDSLPSLCTGWSNGSVCFFFISYCTLKLLNAYNTKQLQIKNTCYNVNGIMVFSISILDLPDIYQLGSLLLLEPVEHLSPADLKTPSAL